MAEIFIIESTDNPVNLHVNGRSASVWIGQDTEIADLFIPALETAGGIVWRYTGQTGPDVEQEPPFDAHAMIAGTVEEVTERLADLTQEQLLAVLDADREVPRKGIRTAVESIFTTRNDAA